MSIVSWRATGDGSARMSATVKAISSWAPQAGQGATASRRGPKRRSRRSSRERSRAPTGRSARSSLAGRLGEAWLGRLGHVVVALPTLVLQLECLDGDFVGVGVEVGERLVLRDPAAVDLVGDGKLPGLVVDL